MCCEGHFEQFIFYQDPPRRTLMTAASIVSSENTTMYRRKLQLKANFESGPSYVNFKSLDPGAFNPGFIG